MNHSQIRINKLGINVLVDNEGYLVEPDDWCPELAEQFASNEGIELNSLHWATVHFIRDYYYSNQVVPAARFALKMLKEKFGEEYANRKALYNLFPYGYGQQACKFAGMRKPLKLMLDV